MFSDTYGGENCNQKQNVPIVILYAVQRPHKNFNNIRIIERRRGTVSKFSKSGFIQVSARQNRSGWNRSIVPDKAEE